MIKWTEILPHKDFQTTELIQVIVLHVNDVTLGPDLPVGPIST